MKWHVVVELTGVDGTVQLHEVGAGGDTTAVCPERGNLGLYGVSRRGDQPAK